MTGPDRKRLFFGLWPSSEVRTRLARLKPPAGRPVAPDNLHITLVFLGAVAAGRQACLERAADRVQSEAFELVFNATGHWRRPRVWWIGPQQVPGALHRLVEQLRAGARACGSEIEDRSYHAHVTLARKVPRAPAAAAVDAITWPVREFVLVESVTAQEGARYTVLRSWLLG